MISSISTKPAAYLDTVASPAGPVAFAVNAAGALLCLQFIEGNYGRTIEQELERAGYAVEADPQLTAQAHCELTEYWSGARQVFSLPLALVGTEWQVAVWRALMTIPFGETRTYAQVAAMVGRPHAARAMGRANATNRLPIVVPCHRVVGTNGSLTGFAGGLHLKKCLLDHEAAILAHDSS